VQLDELALRFETELEHWDAALARIRRLAGSSPRPELWRARASDLLERAGRTAEARAEVRVALSLLEKSPKRIRELATSQELSRELNERLARLDGTGLMSLPNITNVSNINGGEGTRE